MRASPVVCRPMTTHLPAARASRAMRTVSGTLIAMHSCLKKRWWAPQNCAMPCFGATHPSTSSSRDMANSKHSCIVCQNLAQPS